jgi:hypothetical protein
MRFHGLVRGVLALFSAVLLAVLLAGLDAAPGSVPVAGERAASSTHDDGMAAAPTRAMPAMFAIALASVPAPPAAPMLHLLVGSHPFVGRTLATGAPRLAAAVRVAPTVLRV